jgi:hypothetical protein
MHDVGDSQATVGSLGHTDKTRNVYQNSSLNETLSDNRGDILRRRIA